MKVFAKHWWIPAIIVLAFDCVTSFYIWSNGGYDLNPMYDFHTHIGMTMMQALPFYFFMVVFSHVIVFYVTYLASRYISKSYAGLPFLTVFLIYLYVVINNFMVILWGVNLPWWTLSV